MGFRNKEFNTILRITGMSTADNDNDETGRKPLSPAATRALSEAEERRKAEKPAEMPKEIGGRGGADPARFGDWEVNGRAIDF
jgi:hypothetical protein